ncbi:MAG: hydroxymethylglutaryl-CoA lyase [Deltaproteobacteria bacterium]|nr:hydroxymethylglutaryl-CoA lyase [Deltaproteobacteria bacterium]
MTANLDSIRTNLWPSRVAITDVAPRDGLQNESYPVSTREKVALIEGLIEAGVRRIETTSFVHPKAVPQMADAAEVIAGVPKRSDVVYHALIPNLKGYERALACGVTHMGLVICLTESMNQANIRMSVGETLEVSRVVMDRSRVDGVTLRIYLSVAFVCPFEGVQQPGKAVELADAIMALGPEELCLADTVGRGTPNQVAALVALLRHRHDLNRISAHFHNTYDLALANTIAALQQGLARFDSSVAGLGGCPFSPGATGNAATEDLVNMLNGMGVETGIDLDKLCKVSAEVERFSGRMPASAYYRAWTSRKRSQSA